MKKYFGNISKLVMGTLIIGVTITACTSTSKVNNSKKIATEKSTILVNSYSNQFFKANRIDKDIFRISGVNGELMYLIEGANKAVLIDTGTGIGNLKEFVEKITKKPITVILTHGHVDHAPGSALFDDVYMSFADKKLYSEHDTLDTRKGFTSASYKEANTLKDEDYVPLKKSDNFKNLTDGSIFDLGGITLEAIAIPGHTNGMTAILIKEKRILLTGDGCNFFTFLFDNTTSGLTSYEKTIKTLISKVDGKFDKIYLSHGSGDAPKELLTDMIKLCEDIKNGKADNVTFEFMGMKAFIAKKINEDYTRTDGGIANLVYDPKRISE